MEPILWVWLVNLYCHSNINIDQMLYGSSHHQWFNDSYRQKSRTMVRNKYNHNHYYVPFQLVVGGVQR